MAMNMNPVETGGTPPPPAAPPPPPTGSEVDGIENKFNDVKGKLDANPADQGAKEDLNKLGEDTQRAIDGEEGKGKDADPNTLNRLDKALENITQLHNDTFKNGDPGGMGMASAA